MLDEGEPDRRYFAQRAAEEAELAMAATDAKAKAAHVKMQRAYIERASIGHRDGALETAH